MAACHGSPSIGCPPRCAKPRLSLVPQHVAEQPSEDKRAASEAGATDPRLQAIEEAERALAEIVARRKERVERLGLGAPARAAQVSEAGIARFEVRVDGNMMAATEGKQDDALREAMHYFYQYVEEAREIIELVEISQVLCTDRAAMSNQAQKGDE